MKRGLTVVTLLIIGLIFSVNKEHGASLGVEKAFADAPVAPTPGSDGSDSSSDGGGSDV